MGARWGVRASGGGALGGAGKPRGVSGTVPCPARLLHARPCPGHALGPPLAAGAHASAMRQVSELPIMSRNSASLILLRA